MFNKKSNKTVDKNHDKTTGLYKIAAKIMKKVKTGNSYKTQLYQSQYPNKLSLNAVLMNVFKWEKVIDVLIDRSNILEKENNMDRELVSVLITELMWSKFGLKGNAKNILAVKKYKSEFEKLMKENDLEKIASSQLTRVWKPRYVRINTLLTTVEDVLQKLSDQKLKKLETPNSYVEFLELIKSDKFNLNTFVQDLHVKELLVFNSKFKFYKLKEYINGSLIVQDKASCLAAYLLNPKSECTVLDMCAAPGMKTSHLAAIMQNKGKLYAVDRCKDRFSVLQKMLDKYGVKNAELFNMDALTFPYYDDVEYILIDPSCSGSGIVDRVRNDSAGQNENFQLRLKKLANVHAQLLNHALKNYPNIKRLVYSTCSANPEENEAVVDEALSVNGQFKLLDCSELVKGWTNKGAPGYDCSEMCLNAVPSVDCSNGFFIAVFIRRDSEENVEQTVDDDVSTTNMNESSINIKKKVSQLKKDKTRFGLSSPTKKIINEVDSNSGEDVEMEVNNVSTDENEMKIDSVPIKKNKKRANSIAVNEVNENSISKKSKSAKRKERKLKLEQANGNVQEPKKTKKTKTKLT